MDETDPLALGQRVVAILETGLRTATYKLATLTALVDHCVEHMPADPGAALDVPIEDLADRVIEIYWPQVRPFEDVTLRQSTQPRARIIDAVRASATPSGPTFARCRWRWPGCGCPIGTPANARTSR